MGNTRYYDTSDSSETIKRIKIVIGDDGSPASVELNPGTNYWGSYPLISTPNSEGTQVSAQHYHSQVVGELFGAFLHGDIGNEKITGVFVNWLSEEVREFRKFSGPREV